MVVNSDAKSLFRLYQASQNLKTKLVSARVVRTMSFFRDYFNQIMLNIRNVADDLLLEATTTLEKIKNNNGKVIIIGNGGSAAMASHVAVDLTKAAQIRAISFNEASPYYLFCQ